MLMRRSCYLTYVLPVICVLLLHVELTAQEAESQSHDFRSEIFGGLGWARYWGDESQRGDGIDLTGGFAYFPTSRLGFEIEVDGGPHSRDFGGASPVRFEGSSLYLSGNILYRFSTSATQFYVAGGGGLLHSRSETRFPEQEVFESEDTGLAWDVGVGANLFVGTDLSLRPEFRFVAAAESDQPIVSGLSIRVALAYHP